jgi:AhpD family alkylhydroperoxidase
MERVATGRIKYVKAVSPRNAQGLVAEAYRQMQRDFVISPPFTIHSSQPEILAGIWMLVRETMLHGQVRREIKEAIATTVSESNACPYCREVHGMLMHAYSAEKNDAEKKKAIQWAKAIRTPEEPTLKTPPFSGSTAPEYLGTAFIFHYINRMVNIFVEGALTPEMGVLTGLVRSGVFAPVLWLVAHQKVKPGTSLALLPLAPLPQELAWATPNKAIAEALARLAAVIETAGQATIPAPIRSRILTSLDNWHGEAMGISRIWVEDAVADLEEEHKALARLLLLVALAAYQVDEETIRQARVTLREDKSLIAACAWAAFQAAKRITSWLVI